MSQYRIGDMVAVDEYRHAPCTDFDCPGWRSLPGSAQMPSVAAWHEAAYPNSLAALYLRATGGTRDNDYESLSEIVHDFDTVETPPLDAVVVHVRVGDVLDDGNYGTLDYDVGTLLHMADEVCVGGIPARGDESRHCYVHNLQYYERLLRRLPSTVKRAVLCAGSHNDIYFGRSSQYLRGLRDFFIAKGFTVDLRFGRPPDDDLAYMGRARYFIQGGGGFSIMIANLVTRLGGLVLMEHG